MVIFRFFKMTVVRHLGFVCRISRPSTKHIRWSLLACKILLEYMQSFRKYESLNISRGWPIHAQKIKLLGDLPLRWIHISTKPPKAHLYVERRHMTYRSSKSVHRCDACTCSKIRHTNQWRLKLPETLIPLEACGPRLIHPSFNRPNSPSYTASGYGQTDTHTGGAVA